MIKYHLIGVGGVGMSSLAHILHQRKAVVSGSDVVISRHFESLTNLGLALNHGHSEDSIDADTVVVFSSAIHNENVEYRSAIEKGCRLLHRSDLLQELAVGSLPLIVTGSHGKTTTTALLAHLLVQLGDDPSFAIGGEVPTLPAHGGSGSGRFFVLEGDESDGSFLKIPPSGAILTNYESDHLDYWKSEERLKGAFLQFIQSIDRTAPFAWCADDPLLCEYVDRGVSYGFSQRSQMRIEQVRSVEDMTHFDLVWRGKALGTFAMRLVGDHNVRNATGAILLCILLGFDLELLRSALTSFKTVKRRMEYIGSCDGIDYYDDYAHHPTEILASLSAIAEIAKQRRVWVIFQPHRYSRLVAYFDEFVESLSQISRLILLPVYGAGEALDSALDAKLAHSVQPQLLRSATRADVVSVVKEVACSGDIVLTMGAGDVTKVGREAGAKVE